MRILSILCAVFLLFANPLKAENSGFFINPALTIEYSAPSFSSDGVNSEFTTPDFAHQIKEIENIALGAHFRIHKFIGFNVNWAQTDLVNEHGLEGFALAKKPRFRMDYYNFSTVFFAPITDDGMFELFAEIGVSDMENSLSIFEAGGGYSKLKDHQTNAFFGGGFQVAPFENSKDAFRFSFQKYVDEIEILGADFSTFRIGYVKHF